MHRDTKTIQANANAEYTCVEVVWMWNVGSTTHFVKTELHLKIINIPNDHGATIKVNKTSKLIFCRKTRTRFQVLCCRKSSWGQKKNTSVELHQTFYIMYIQDYWNTDFHRRFYVLWILIYTEFSDFIVSLIICLSSPLIHQKNITKAYISHFIG